MHSTFIVLRNMYFLSPSFSHQNVINYGIVSLLVCFSFVSSLKNFQLFLCWNSFVKFNDIPHGCFSSFSYFFMVKLLLLFALFFFFVFIVRAFVHFFSPHFQTRRCFSYVISYLSQFFFQQENKCDSLLHRCTTCNLKWLSWICAN